MSYVLFTDSSCNLSQKMLDNNNISCIPFSFSINGKSDITDKDISSFDAKKYYDRMRQGMTVTTSQVTPDKYMDAFKEELEKGNDILYIGLSSAVSGAFSSAQVARRELLEEYPDRIIVLADSRGASLGVGLVVLQAAANLENGLSLKDNYENLKIYIRSLYQVFTVDDLNYLKNTGRISGKDALVGNVLNIKPVLKGSPRGEIVATGKARGTKKAIGAMLEKYNTLVKDSKNQVVAIAHADNEEGALLLSQGLKELNPPKKILIENFDPVMGAHVGPGALALFFIGEEGVREKWYYIIMDRIINYVISNEYDGISLLAFLELKGYSSKILTKLRKDCSCTLINNKPSFLNSKLFSGDNISVHIKEESVNEKIVPVEISFDIVYEDEDIILINKPFDMPIHPSLNNYDNSLANALSYYFQNESTPFIYRCLNRLDRDTSGLTLVAKNPLSGAVLSRDMKYRKISRTYTAIVSGKLDENNGTIDKPIGRKMQSCIERCIDYKNGEKAVTHFQVIKYYPASDLSLVKLNLETGRTHQIRVHMKSIGHPLIGDFLYYPEGMDIIKRQALHAGELAFIHPITREEMHFTLPLPPDMSAVIS